MASPAVDPPVDTSLHAAQHLAARLLAAQPKRRRELFSHRLACWWGDLYDGLAGAYPSEVVDDLLPRLVSVAAGAFAVRDPGLQRLDEERTHNPQWFAAPHMVGYAAYAERFGGDLAGVAKRIPYLRELGVTYLHLLPLLATRDGDNDGGFAVSDYRQVRADLGSVDDLRSLATELRHAGISLVLDLVLNHVAREHDWAAAARGGSARHRAYFHVFPDRAVPDAFEATLPEVFPDFAPGNFTWDEDLRGWVWTTFNAWQWDVNWSNPNVFTEYADIVLFLANVGVEVMRLDAIAYLWKTMGTSCQNQPQVHAITQALRALVRIVCPAVIFKAEAIVEPRSLVAYLGVGPFAGKVSDLAYHNSLMVQVWSMLATKDVRLTAQAMRQLPRIPSTAGWVTYVRSHDDIGWAVDDDDARRVGLDAHAHRAFLSSFYAGDFPGSCARGLLFQSNSRTGDSRISGTAASLAGVEAALACGDERALTLAVRRVLLAHALVYSWGGIPVIWSGDELGCVNDPAWASEPGHETDNRWSHRPRIDDHIATIRHDPGSVSHQIFTGLAELGAARAQLPQLEASIPTHVVDTGNDAILAVLRNHSAGDFLGLFNVSAETQALPGDVAKWLGLFDAVEVLDNAGGRVDAEGCYSLSPYAVAWLVIRP